MHLQHVDDPLHERLVRPWKLPRPLADDGDVQLEPGVRSVAEGVVHNAPLRALGRVSRFGSGTARRAAFVPRPDPLLAEPGAAQQLVRPSDPSARPEQTSDGHFRREPLRLAAKTPGAAPSPQRPAQSTRAPVRFENGLQRHDRGHPGKNPTIRTLRFSNRFFFFQSGNDGVLDGIRVLGEAISRKQTTLAALTSIVEVKVETALVSEEQQTNKYLIALICLILIGGSAAATAGLLYWRQRKRNLGLSGVNLTGTASDHRNHDDEKSNNLQNEENLRRYANPLKEEAIGGVMTQGVVGPPCLDLGVPRVSVVRPLSSLMPGAGEGSSEMLEMISEADCPGSRKGVALVVAGPSNDGGLKPVHRNSQILLYKAQNPDVRKNTAAFDDSTAHKDFTKSVINMNMLPVQRTSQHNGTGGGGNGSGGDVLTVLV